MRAHGSVLRAHMAQGSLFKVQGSWLRAAGSWLVQDSWFKVQQLPLSPGETAARTKNLAVRERAKTALLLGRRPCRRTRRWERPRVSVQGSGFMVHGSGFMVHGTGFMVQGSWFRVHGSWFMVHLRMRPALALRLIRHHLKPNHLLPPARLGGLGFRV